MTVSKNLSDAINEFGESAFLGANYAVSKLLRETAKDKNLCAYIENNGSNVVFEREFVSAFGDGKKFNPDPSVTVPFVYSVLYLVDSGKSGFTLEAFLEKAYNTDDIDKSYTAFCSSVASALKNALANADTESVKTVPETARSEVQNPKFALNLPFGETEAYLRINLSGEDFTDVKNIIDSLRRDLDCGNASVLKSLYIGLSAIVKSRNLDTRCLVPVETELAKRKAV